MALTIFPKEQNFIKFIISHPCATPWYVWVETFLPAFIILYATTAFFDVEDAIRAHGKKISGKGGRRKGKRHSPKVRVTGAETRVARWSQKGLRTLLILTGPLEVIGFLWLIYAAVDQFFLNWETLLRKRDFCKTNANTGPLQLSREEGFISLVTGGVPVILDTTEQNRSTWAHTSIGATLPGGEFHAGFALTVRAPAGGVNGLWIRLRIGGLFGDNFFQSSTLDLGPNEEGDLNVAGHFNYVTGAGGPLSWEIGGNTIPAGILAIKGWMFCHMSDE